MLHKLYKRFVISTFCIAVIWGIIEFSDLFFNCTDWCGIEFLFIIPILFILFLVLGIWSLIRNTSAEIKKANAQAASAKNIFVYFMLFAPVIIPFFYLPLQNIQNPEYDILSYFYGEDLFIVFGPAILATIFGVFLKEKTRIVSLFILLSIESIFILGTMRYLSPFFLESITLALFIGIPLAIWYHFARTKKINE